jgi:hypothetical protein
LLLSVPKRIPVKMSPASKKTEALIPSAGIAIPEIRMNPRAEPARSALYTDEETDPSGWSSLSLLKIFPVKNDAGNIKSIMMANDNIRLFISSNGFTHSASK